MAKKKTTNAAPILSPEKYIRQKARTLPIYECWVNKNWDKIGIANALVARKHSNGNITFGIYLVDLKCLGVKDSNYWFNIPEFEYRDILNEISDELDLKPDTYVQIHNIVFAGVEFADEYGFKPHPDFTSVAQFILENDDDNVELVEINCGIEGKPAYIRGPYDTNAQTAEIVQQLERTAGKGNYLFLDSPDMEENEDDDLNHSIFDDIIGDDIFENADQYSEEIIKNLLKVKSRGFQFKIQIENISHPPVWRKVIVPSHYSFTFFHFIIQDVFGWSHFHMYQFSPKGWGSYPIIKQISEDDFETGEALESTDTMLSDIFKKEGEKFTYIYDFGDDWKHTITLEKILSEEINQPVCIDGKGQCPPEDCGGSPGFENMKAILADSSHPEYEETKEWLDLGDDEIWNPNEFNLQEVQENLNSFFTLNSELKLN